MTDYGPSITLARLYERVSAKGNHYLIGRIGLAKIAILKSDDKSDDGHPIWNVVLQQAPMKNTRQDGAPTQSEDAEVQKAERRAMRRKRREPKLQKHYDVRPGDDVPDFVGDAA